MCIQKKYDLNEEAINIIKSCHAKFKVKSLTQEGQERKERLTIKLFHQKPKFQLTAYFFLSVPPLNKSSFDSRAERALNSYHSFDVM